MRGISRGVTVLAVLISSLLAATATAAGAEPRKPNILVMDRSGRSATATSSWSPRARAAESNNVVQDPAESNDLSAAQPDKVKELRAMWDKWNAEQAPPAAAADANRPAAKRKKGREKAKPQSADK